MENLLKVNQNHCTAISLPSIRAGRLTPELMKIIRKVRKTGFTIAPEAGTQRLRDVINKNITEEDIVDTVTNAFDLGWRNIKLYFMNGLPSETQEDIQGICDLARKLASIKTNGQGQEYHQLKLCHLHTKGTHPLPAQPPDPDPGNLWKTSTFSKRTLGIPASTSSGRTRR